MRIKLIIISLLILSGCGSKTYQNTKGKHQFTSEKLKKYNKEGRACVESVLFSSPNLVDFTVDTARKKSGIEEIVFVNYELTHIPLIYKKECIVVKGN